MKIRIIFVGKMKDSWIQESADEFLKRLKPFADMEIVTLKDVSPSKTVTVARCINEEGESILGALKEGEFVVALDERGKALDSVEFAEFLRRKKDMGEKICFIIGGAFGLSDAVKERADLLFSMSKMTFTHQMIRVFLLEQIYRGICIIHGKEYHNG